MKPRNRLVEILLLVLLVPLFVILAALQITWLQKVSKADEERMAAAIQSGAKQLAAEVSNELAVMQLLFQADSAGTGGAELARFQSQWSYWKQNAPYPELVDDVVILKRDIAGGLSAQRFDPAAQSFTPISPSASRIAALAKRLLSPGETGDDGLLPDPGRFLDIPALVIPIVAPPGEQPSGKEISASGYVCALLNREVLEQQVLPSMIRDSFEGTVDLRDFTVQIIDTAANRLIYPPSGATPAYQAMDQQPDVAMPILGATRMMIIKKPSTEDQSTTMEASGLDLLKTMTWMKLRSTSSSESREVTSISAQAVTLTGSGWLLTVTHKAGSVNQAARSMMYRNLSLSLGILLVLAASVVLLYMSFRKAREAGNRQREFVASVSHELRTPLSVICAAGENLSDGLIRDEEKVKGYGELIRREGRRLRDMVEKVLVASRLQTTSRRPGAPGDEPIDIAELVRWAVSLQEERCAKTGIRIDVRTEPDLPPVRGNNESLRSAVQNLIDNAVLHGGDGKLVRVSLDARDGRRGRILCMRVEDHGKGMSRGDMARLFRPFARGQSAIQEQVPGTGLGLTIAQRAAAAHGGAIRVQSAPGKGSVFELILPTERGR